MRLTVIRFTLCSVLAFGVAPAAAQAPTGGAGPAVILNAEEFPVSLERIKRRMARLPKTDRQRDFLRLSYYIDVYGRAPKIDLIQGFDVHTGPIPYGSPTHSEMVNAMTPREWRPATANLSGVGWTMRSLNAPR